MKKLSISISLIVTLTLLISAVCICNFSAAALTEKVIFDGDVTFSGTTASWGGLIVPIDDITQAIRDDYAANGAISGDEYYKFDVTGTSDDYICPGFYQDGPPYLEAWGVQENGAYVVRPTATKKNGTVIDAGNLVCGLTQFCVYNDGNAAITLTHVKISVFRGEGGGSSSTTSTVPPTPSTVSVPSEVSLPGDVVKGDANGDQKVDMKDVLAVRKHIANLDVAGMFNSDAADFNGDSVIDMKDVLAMRKLIAST